MSLLREIQNAAASSDVCVADLLRKCKILAVRLKSRELAEWVDKELNGYQEETPLPEYRKLGFVDNVGNFAGPFGSSASNIPIPMSHIPKTLHHALEELNLRQGIAEYEAMLSTMPGGEYRVLWPNDWLHLLHDKVVLRQQCMGAWRRVSRSSIVRVVDSVKSRILEFAISIEFENPEAGEAQLNETPVEPQVVKSIVNQHFYGTVGNIATSSNDFQQTANINPVDKQLNLNVDWQQLSQELICLRNALVKVATEPEHYQAIASVAEAEKAIEADDKPKALESLKKAGTWVGNAATNIGTTLVAEVIKKMLMPGP